MVNIDNKDIAFSYIDNMYKGAKAGVGLQVNEDINEDKMNKMCIKIAEAVIEYHKG